MEMRLVSSRYSTTFFSLLNIVSGASGYYASSKAFFKDSTGWLRGNLQFNWGENVNIAYVHVAWVKPALCARCHSFLRGAMNRCFTKSMCQIMIPHRRIPNVSNISPPRLLILELTSLLLNELRVHIRT